MILCLISVRYFIKILVDVLLQQKIRSQILELARIDSRARASKIASSTNEESWIKFGSSQDGEENFQDLSLVFISVKILFLDKM